MKVASSMKGVRGGNCSPPPVGHIWLQGESDSMGRMHHMSDSLGVWANNGSKGLVCNAPEGEPRGKAQGCARLSGSREALR
jgi:hypothetical protein